MLDKEDEFVYNSDENEVSGLKTRGRTKRTGKPRAAETYRGARRNKSFGRKSVGNMTPAERIAIYNNQG
jgi:hypothetical protein